MSKYQATIILRHGSKISLADWQQLYGLPVGSNKIGKHFIIGEKNLRGDVVIKNGCTISELVLHILDETRELRGKPTMINDFDRTRADQLDLIARGFRAAKFSPHEVFCATDVDETNKADTIVLAKTIGLAARRLGIKVRIGVNKYLKDGNTFVHFDVCPEYYAPGKPWHHKKHHPAWEVEARW